MKQLLLNRNEVERSPSPKALKALRNFQSNHASRYIEGYYSSILIKKLAGIFKISEDRIIVSYGEEDFFRTVFEKLQRGDSVLTHQWHYSFFEKYLPSKGIRLRRFKMHQRQGAFEFDVQDCIRQYKKFKPPVIIITSPNNPTGNSVSAKDLKKILQAVGRETLVLLDEAYFGFDPHYRQADFLALIESYPNLAILRSFSKLYALAGLRVGFALCGRRVKKMLNYQNRYLGLSRVLEETAIAALESKDHYKKISNAVVANRKFFIKRAGSLKNFRPFESKGNFVLVQVAPKVGPYLKRLLSKEPVLIGKFVDRNLLRVTAGSAKHTRRLIRLFAKADKI